MNDYYIEVELDRLICRDTESLHSSDKVALFGSVFTDVDESGFVLPVIRIGSGQDVRIQDDYRIIFKGRSGSPQFGLVLFGYDIDDNKPWIENRADIISASKLIAKGVKLIPKVGPIIGKVLDEVNETVPPVIDQFVAWDKNDKLLDYSAVEDAPNEGAHNPKWRTISVDFQREGALGYASWDYSLKINVKGYYGPVFDDQPLGEAHRVPRKDTTLDSWIGAWHSPNIRADIGHADVPDKLNILLTDKTTGVAVHHNRVAISSPPTLVKIDSPVDNIPFGLLDPPFLKPGPSGSAPSTTEANDEGDYLALEGEITLEYYGVEGDKKALRPALRYRWPTSLPVFIGYSEMGRRDEYLTLSLNIG